MKVVKALLGIPLLGSATAVVLAGYCGVTVFLAGCMLAPRDDHPERVTPSPSTSECPFGGCDR